ncbi:stage II sporulation protein M [Candidatus Woesearchaeota archaeon]|nr:stage II sporulation protein M [Candidatus Woesearchaeota archaeon]
MVLESLFNPFSVKKRPWEMFIAGFMYSIVGMVLSYFVFREIAGILMVFLIVMAALPMLYSSVQNEEELDLQYTGEFKLLKEHTKVLIFLIFLFLGITAALVLSYVFLPQPVVDSIFSLQEKAILNVNQNIQGHITGGIARLDFFVKILINNLKVLFFCLIFSLLYGTGAIFILTWNASVIATAIGNLVKTELAQTASLVGLPFVAAYFSATTLSFFRYMTHGLFEIAAYFVMGLAGGIISIAIIKHNLQEDKVLIDALDLIFISFGLLIIAAVIEVYVTPMLFA